MYVIYCGVSVSQAASAVMPQCNSGGFVYSLILDTMKYCFLNANQAKDREGVREDNMKFQCKLKGWGEIGDRIGDGYKW